MPVLFSNLNLLYLRKAFLITIIAFSIIIIILGKKMDLSLRLPSKKII